MIESRVKSLLSKFENNLNGLNLEQSTNPTRPSFFTFKRSATCIDFNKLQSGNDNENNKNIKNEIKSDSSFDRPTSENSKRGSIIRRSPAFRLHKNEKPAIGKAKDEKRHQHQLAPPSILPSDYAYLSGTLRKALKQPLPIGPPPKKPPRTFESPIKEIVPLPTLESSEESSNSSSNQNLTKIPEISSIESKKSAESSRDCENHYYDTVSSVSYQDESEEPIYSEPVIHRPRESMNTSCCSNSDHLSDAGDLHYMVSQILSSLTIFSFFKT